MGFIKDRPSTGAPSGVHSRTSKLVLRPEAATPRTRSALVVPPDFGGLLHPTACRFVAPCSRPWGSPCFRSAVRGPKTPGRSPFPMAPHPSKRFPPEQPLPRQSGEPGSPRRLALPPLVRAAPSFARRVATVRAGGASLPSTSGLCSTLESVAGPLALPPAVRPMLPWASIQQRDGDASRVSGRARRPGGAVGVRPRRAGLR